GEAEPCGGGGGQGSPARGPLGSKWPGRQGERAPEGGGKEPASASWLRRDRIPWLCNLHDILLRDVASGQHVVLACSALKKVYRDILIRGKDGGPLKCEQMRKDKQPAEVKLLVVYLSGSFEVISGRLLKRKGHFMPPELLQSQFDTLEPPSDPENFIQINVDKNLSEIIATIMGTLR
uniref:gluconokinase n=1 Tax=Felis catus TaxID=9685 RepID=A0ABI7WJK6_FELCA